MLMMEVQNLMLAATLAKMNILSPNILDHEDLKSVWLEEPTNTSKILLSNSISTRITFVYVNI